MKTLNPSSPLATLVGSLLFGLLFVQSVGADDKAAKAKADAKVVHHLTLSGAYSERPGTSLDLTSLVMGGGLSSKSYFKLVDHVEALAKDDEVDCVLLDLSQPFMLGKVNTRDFATRLAKLNAAGKRTIAWVGSVDTANLGVASACSEIFMSSDGMVDIPSATMSHTFYKDLFNLLGVNVTAVRSGDFKGAVEPFTRAEMSAHLRRHYEAMLRSMNDAAVAQIAAGRKLPAARVRELQQQRLMRPVEAKAAKLIDRLVEPGHMREAVAAALRAKVEWREPKKKPPKSFGFTDLLKLLAGGGGAADKKNTKPTVVVYHLHGQIMDGHKPSAGSLIDGPTVKALDELRADPQVKGVVLRINSPGGSATASENIRVAIERLVVAKPVVFSMGEVAASGGYLVACAKAPIFADADTITGSIGVFGMALSFDTLLRRVGVNLETIAIDEAARQFEIGKLWTDEELAKLQQHVDATYDLFLKRVSAARNLPVAKLKPLAGGRVWSGAQAKAHGLVDHLGGLGESLEHLRKEAKLANNDNVEIKHLPKASAGLDLSSLLGGDEDEIFQGELKRQLTKIRALGIDTGPLEFLLRHAHQKPSGPKTMNSWMLQPMNFKVR